MEVEEDRKIEFEWRACLQKVLEANGIKVLEEPLTEYPPSYKWAYTCPLKSETPNTNRLTQITSFEDFKGRKYFTEGFIQTSEGCNDNYVLEIYVWY